MTARCPTCAQPLPSAEPLSPLLRVRVDDVLTPERIARVTCRALMVQYADFAARSRSSRVAEARHVARYLTRTILRASYPEIGRAFGDREHHAAMHSVELVTRLRAEAPAYRLKVEQIELLARKEAA